MPPAPKRKSERRRRNIVVGETTTYIAPELKVPQPPLLETEYFSPHAIAWYDSLARSGQAIYYEPSDWEYAQLIAGWITDYDLSIKPSVTLLRYIIDGMKHLLVSEDSRRRAHMEFKRDTDDEELPPEISAIEEYRQRLGYER